MFEKINSSTTKYAETKPWWLYLLVWLFLAFLFTDILKFHSNHSNFFVVGIMYFVELGVHEVSHLLTAFLPSVLTASAGSFGEILFTSLVVYAGLRYRAYFVAAFGLLWMMLAFNSTGIYMADARAQSLPLVGPGPEPTHDWHFVFDRLGLLSHDHFIGGAFRVFGDILGLLGLLFGAWLIYKMLFKDSSLPAKQAKTLAESPHPGKQAPSSLYPSATHGVLSPKPPEDDLNLPNKTKT